MIRITKDTKSGSPKKSIIPDSSASSPNDSTNSVCSMFSKINLLSIPSSIASLKASKTVLVFTGWVKTTKVVIINYTVKKSGTIFFITCPAKTCKINIITAVVPIEIAATSTTFPMIS